MTKLAEDLKFVVQHNDNELRELAKQLLIAQIHYKGMRSSYNEEETDRYIKNATEAAVKYAKGLLDQLNKEEK